MQITVAADYITKIKYDRHDKANISQLLKMFKDFILNREFLPCLLQH